jgi:hypothetical protein
VYVGKLRAVAEEGVGQPRAEQESRSVLEVKDTTLKTGPVGGANSVSV